MNDQHSSSSSSPSPYPNLNQTYPAINHSSSSSNQSSLGLGGYPSHHLDNKLDDKSPLNRFRHDNLNSGFNPHLPHQQSPHGLHSGAFHHPQTATGGGSSSSYNLMSVKKEPGILDDGQPIKSDGYEKNYQNFIRYGEYNDSSQPPQSQLSQHGSSSLSGSTKSEYNSYYSPYGTYPGYQNYPNYHNQNFNSPSGSSALPPAPEVSTPLPAITTPVAHQTNFEQQIPAHTYPIPKNTGIPQPDIPIKLEAEDNSYLTNTTNTSVPPLSEPSPVNNNLPSAIPNSAPKTPPEPEAPPPVQPTTTPTTGKSKKSEKKDKANKDSASGDGEIKSEGSSSKSSKKKESKSTKKEQEAASIKQAEDEKLEKAHKPEAPDCDCFTSSDTKAPSEPGSYYTHLGKLICST